MWLLYSNPPLLLRRERSPNIHLPNNPTKHLTTVPPTQVFDDKSRTILKNSLAGEYLDDFEHGYSFRYFGCRAVNVFVVCDFRAKDETQYLGMCVYVCSYDDMCVFAICTLLYVALIITFTHFYEVCQLPNLLMVIQ